MEVKTEKVPYKLIAAISFILVAIFKLTELVKIAPGLFYDQYIISYIIELAISIAGYAVIVSGIFMQKRRILMIFGFSVIAIPVLINFNVSINWFLHMIGIISAIALSVICITDVFPQFKNTAKKLFFIPAIFFGTYSLIVLIKIGFTYCIDLLLETAAILFTGLLLKEHQPIISTKNENKSGGFVMNHNEVQDIEALADNLLKAIKPNLKAPMTAVLCSTDELVITNNNDNTYTVEGYVNSQNSYGAMISTDFTAHVRYSNNMWVVNNTVIGAKNAKTYAKTFAANYIILSIFCGVMGLIGYFILTTIIR